MAYLLILIFLILQSPSPIYLSLAIISHETAHVATSLALTGRIPRIYIKGIGFILDCGPISNTKQRLAINLSGPAANLLLWIIFHRHKHFASINLGLFVLSMLPCSFLDGGQVSGAILEKFLPPHTAYSIEKILSHLTFSLIFVFNCAVQLKFGTNLSLLCFTIFLTLTLYGKER